MARRIAVVAAAFLALATVLPAALALAPGPAANTMFMQLMKETQQDTLNITATANKPNNQVNVSTGVTEGIVDNVHLHMELFGAKAPAAAPAASKAPKKGGSTDDAAGLAGADDATPTGAASARAVVGWIVAGLAAAVLGYLL